MAKFMIEVSDIPEAVAEKRINDAIHTLGSHFATHAAWYETKGACTGIMTIEVGNESEALAVVPPSMRPHAQVWQLRL